MNTKASMYLLIVLSLLLHRKGRRNYYYSICCWAPLGRYNLENCKGYRGNHICCGFQPQEGEVRLLYIWRLDCFQHLIYTKSRHLQSEILMEQILMASMRPAVLITDAYNGLLNQPPSKAFMPYSCAWGLMTCLSLLS